MAGFSLIKDAGVTEYRTYTISSQAFTIGDLVDTSRTAGTVTPSTSTSTTYTIRGVAMQTVTTAATSLLIALATPFQLWKVPATNTTNTAHNGQRMVLTDKATINNTGTDSTATTGVFEQFGVNSTTVLVGRLLVGSLTTG